MRTHCTRQGSSVHPSQAWSIRCRLRPIRRDRSDDPRRGRDRRSAGIAREASVLSELHGNSSEIARVWISCTERWRIRRSPGSTDASRCGDATVTGGFMGHVETPESDITGPVGLRRHSRPRSTASRYRTAALEQLWRAPTAQRDLTDHALPVRRDAHRTPPLVVLTEAMGMAVPAWAVLAAREQPVALPTAVLAALVWAGVRTVRGRWASGPPRTRRGRWRSSGTGSSSWACSRSRGPLRAMRSIRPPRWCPPRPARPWRPR